MATKPCPCGHPRCRGRDPKRPSVHHRVPGRVVAVWAQDAGGPWVVVEADGHLWNLVPRRQAPADTQVGDRGTLEYRVTPTAGLHHFVRRRRAPLDPA